MHATFHIVYDLLIVVRILILSFDNCQLLKINQKNNSLFINYLLIKLQEFYESINIFVFLKI
jgi:hypothetical protein